MADNTTPTPLDLARMSGSVSTNDEVNKAVVDEAKQDKIAGQGHAGEMEKSTEQVDEKAGGSPDVSSDGDKVDDETTGDMFPRKYVEELRAESAKYRERAKAADALGQRLHEALVKLDGRLADPADLPFDAKHLDDPAALDAAIDALVTAKPGLRARGFTGNVGQGSRGTKKPTGVNLIDLMRG